MPPLETASRLREVGLEGLPDPLLFVLQLPPNRQQVLLALRPRHLKAFRIVVLADRVQVVILHVRTGAHLGLGLQGEALLREVALGLYFGAGEGRGAAVCYLVFSEEGVQVESLPH